MNHTKVIEQSADLGGFIGKAPFPMFERSIYAPSTRSRVAGAAGTCMLFLFVIAAFFLTITHVQMAPAPPALTVMSLPESASPPQAQPEEKEAPKPIDRQEPEPEPAKVAPIQPPTIVVAPVSMPPPAVKPEPVDPGPPQRDTAAPRTVPAPPAVQARTNTNDSWEGRVLAALNEQRRYPRVAMARRQQGVPYIRFVMDRDGRVLSSRLERSSGYAELDREALALPKRASPLPKPPGDRQGDTLELVVPVEFFLR